LRRGNYEEALDLIRANPIAGRGFTEALAFHSVPLQVLVIAGFLGAVALFVVGRACWRAARDSMRSPVEPIAQLCAAGMVGAFAALIVSNQLLDRYFTLGIALMSYGCWKALPIDAPRSDPTARAPLSYRERAKSPLTPNRPTIS
jgi:O-antigen ligase